MKNITNIILIIVIKHFWVVDSSFGGEDWPFSSHFKINNLNPLVEIKYFKIMKS